MNLSTVRIQGFTSLGFGQAMLIAMQTHPDPTDWAAFTLIGEGE